MMMCFIVLGMAMFRAPTFGRGFGEVSMILGMIGVMGVAATLFVTGEIGMQVMEVAVFPNIIFLPLSDGRSTVCRGPNRNPEKEYLAPMYVSKGCTMPWKLGRSALMIWLPEFNNSGRNKDYY